MANPRHVEILERRVEVWDEWRRGWFIWGRADAVRPYGEG